MTKIITEDFNLSKSNAVTVTWPEVKAKEESYVIFKPLLLISITISNLVYQLILYNWNGKTAVLIDRYKQNPDFICLTDTALVNAGIYLA